MERLSVVPWPPSPAVKKVSGRSRLHRLRVGDYRAVFERSGGTVVVLRVVDRKNLERILKRL